MLAGFIMVRKFTPEPVPVLDLRRWAKARRSLHAQERSGGTLAQDMLVDPISASHGSLLFSHPGPWGILMCSSPPNQPLLWEEVNPGFAKSFGIFQDQKNHLSTRHCHYCNTEGVINERM